MRAEGTIGSMSRTPAEASTTKPKTITRGRPMKPVRFLDTMPKRTRWVEALGAVFGLTMAAASLAVVVGLAVVVWHWVLQ